MSSTVLSGRAFKAGKGAPDFANSEEFHAVPTPFQKFSNTAENKSSKKSTSQLGHVFLHFSLWILVALLDEAFCNWNLTQLASPFNRFLDPRRQKTKCPKSGSRSARWILFGIKGIFESMIFLFPRLDILVP